MRDPGPDANGRCRRKRVLLLSIAAALVALGIVGILADIGTESGSPERVSNRVESAVPSACGVGCSYDYSRRYSCEPCWVQERRLHARCRSSWRSVELSLLGSSWTTADLLYGKASRTGRNLAYAAPGRLPFLVNG
jgi:hypothetical protein